MKHKKWRRKTWSKGLEWDGFRPVAYSFGDRAWELPITELTKDSSVEGAALAETPTTVGDAFGRVVGLGGGEIGKIKSTFARGEGRDGPHYILDVESPSGQGHFCGSEFNVRVLEALLRLQKEGTNPVEASLFFYDYDSSTHDPADKYDFFVVCNDKIVEERVGFSDSPRNGFDPAVFSADDVDDPFSFRENDNFQAWVRFWYRKFYAETRAGQLMVLRPDEPELYFYPEGRWAWKLPAVSVRIERRSNALQVVLIVIGFLALVLLRR